jgi:hypothetical protein
MKDRKATFGRVELVPTRHQFTFRKEEWPSPDACHGCRRREEKRHVQLRSQEADSSWQRAAVVNYLHTAYCLDSHFECWAEKHDGGRRWPAGHRVQWRNVLAALALVLGLAMLTWVCCAAWARDQMEERLKAKTRFKSAESMA